MLSKPLLLNTVLGVCWTRIVMQEHTRHLHNDPSCVDIDLCYLTGGTEAESSSSSSHAMHQNNWQCPIILWSVYRRSDERHENESVIRKPRVWIADVSLAGQTVLINQGRTAANITKMRHLFSYFKKNKIKCNVKIQHRKQIYWRVLAYVT